MMKRNNFYALLASVMLAATAGLMTSCATEDNPTTPSGPSEAVVKEKIVGKWKLSEINNRDQVTNGRMILTYNENATLAVSISYFNKETNSYIWRNKQPGIYSIDGNVIKNYLNQSGLYDATPHYIEAISDEAMTMSSTSGGQTIYTRVAADYTSDIIGMWEVTEMTGEETYNDDNARLAFLADGTYRYYRKDDTGEWQLVSTRDVEEYFVDGDWMATRWQEKGGEMNYEWWDIDEIKDGQMKWSALREREDGTRFKTTFTWKKVDDIAFLIDEEHFPDATLRKKLTTSVYGIKGDINRTYNYGDDGVITTEELEKVVRLSIGYSDIENYEGIELFTELTQLTCPQTSIKTLDLKLPKLVTLDCSGSKLTKIDMSGCPELKVLLCKYSNSLESIDLSKNTKLEYLECESCALTTLDVSKCTNLMSLSCSDNKLPALDVSNLSKLETLTCTSNHMSALNVSGCPSFSFLDISLNQFKGEALDAVIANLPLKKELLGTLSVLNNAMGDYEQNEITETQIAAANDRGWTVQIGSEQYPGTLVSE